MFLYKGDDPVVPRLPGHLLCGKVALAPDQGIRAGFEQQLGNARIVVSCRVHQRSQPGVVRVVGVCTSLQQKPGQAKSPAMSL